MARRVFYSFHYSADCARASQVRNIGAIEGNRPATDNEWEQVKRGGDRAIERWIADQLNGKSACIVLIGSETASRKWVLHEISEAWNAGKGVAGIYVHNLKDLNGRTTRQGTNPFDLVSFTANGVALSRVAKAYNPPHYDSKQVYAWISSSLSLIIDEAIRIRGQHP